MDSSTNSTSTSINTSSASKSTCAGKSKSRTITATPLQRILTILLLGMALSTAQLQAQVKRSLPKEFKKLRFGMSMEEFARNRSSIDPNRLSKDKFRYTWVESFSDKKPYHTAKYYFSDKSERSFYEVIFFYRDLQHRDSWCQKYFGTPNAKNNTEWRLTDKQGMEFRAWRYEDRLVITALLPGTEWHEKR